MDTVYVISQNLKLDSLRRHQNKKGANVFVSTNFLFENERAIIGKLFSNVEFITFADCLSDEEMARCDIEAYTSPEISHEEYINKIRLLKNTIVAEKIAKKYSNYQKFVLCDDLGIDYDAWKKYGFKRKYGKYYYPEGFVNTVKICLSHVAVLRTIYHVVKKIKQTDVFNPKEVHVSHFEGKKYVFLGKMSRIEYRLDIKFEESEEECSRLNAGEFESKESCVYMTTWHEQGKCKIPDDEKYAVRWAQDGYLPPNYSHKDYFFKPSNVVYYCWDVLGTNLFKNQGLPYEMIPFRKKSYLPNPVFPKEVKKILIVASGSGDWTALKNRSDDDIMVDAFAQMAKRFPHIHFTYRCHPTWVHPLNVGVNAVNRVHDYFEALDLPNLTLSSNMPLANDEGKFQLSFSRSSLEEDLKNADFVFGEHSISMIDAAFKGIPFCSVNLTNRRNFFIGINDLGFPTVSSHDQIAEIIDNVVSADFQRNYLKAVQSYNRMTEEDF